MIRSARGLAALALVAACVAVVLPAPPASAADRPPAIGGLTVDPAKGVATSSITVTTSAPCPKGTNLLGKIYGHGFPADGQNTVPNTPVTIYEKAPSGGYRVPFQDTIDDFLKLQPGNQKLQGSYTLAIQCRNAFGAPFSQFVGTLTFSSPTSFTAQPPKSYPTPPAPSAAAPGTTGGQGQAGGQAGGQSGAQPQASGFPNAPNAAPGAPTTSVDDAFSVSSSVGIPLALVVVALVLVGGWAFWRNRRRGAAGPERVGDVPRARPVTEAEMEQAAEDEAASELDDGSAPEPPAGSEDEQAWPSHPLRR